MLAKIPSLKNIFHYLIVSLVVFFIFVFIYFYTNDKAQIGETYSLFFEIEKKIPFIPGFIIIYFSLNLLMTMPIFYMNSKQILWFGVEVIFGTIIAGGFFLFLPAQLGFERQVPSGMFESVYKALFEIDRPHNLVPSLHIFYSYISILHLEKLTINRWWHLWGVLMCFAVLFTHQHHLLDIFGGVLLALFSYHLIKRARK